MAAPAVSPKQWMLGLPGHNEIMRFEEVLALVKSGQLRPTDLVKKLGEPWKAANEIAELAEYFAEPRKAPAAPKAEAPRPAAAAPAPAAKPPAPAPPPPPPPAPAPRGVTRPMTSRVPTLGSSPPERKTTPVPAKAEAPPPDPAREETKPPDAEKAEKPDSRAASSKPAEETKHAPLEEKPKPGESRLRSRKTREIPKPPPPAAPLLEPMVGKYLGPVDLLRCASFAFDPRKLLLTACGIAPIGILTSLLWHLSDNRDNPREWAMAAVAGALWIFGLPFITTTLAYLTRRQVEGASYRIPEVVAYGVSNATLSVVYPAIAVLPSLASVVVLYGFRYVNNTGSGGASFVKIAYFLPMTFALLAMAGAIIYQLALMYVPAAAAIEGTRVSPSVNTAWNTVRRQWGRVVLHWLIITVAVGVICIVGLVMAWQAVALPRRIFGFDPENFRVNAAWENFAGLFSVYQGLAIGLGLTLPVSLLSTLGTLSYVSLRHPASAQLSPSAMDETSGIAIGPSGTRHGSSPGEATQPGETRPAPPDATRPGPGATPPPSDITDDSDEQPLVKD